MDDSSLSPLKMGMLGVDKGGKLGYDGSRLLLQLLHMYMCGGEMADKNIEKDLENKKRANDIKLKFRNLIRSYLDEVNLQSVPTKAFAKIDAKGTESGSKTPRELMAYYYAILNIMRERSSSTYFPIVIDSPNQQAQDAENLPVCRSQ